MSVLLVVAGQLTKGHYESRAAWKPLGSESVAVYGDRASALCVQAKFARVTTGGGSVAASSQGVPTQRESSLAVALKDRTK